MSNNTKQGYLVAGGHMLAVDERYSNKLDFLTEGMILAHYLITRGIRLIMNDDWDVMTGLLWRITPGSGVLRGVFGCDDWYRNGDTGWRSDTTDAGSIHGGTRRT